MKKTLITLFLLLFCSTAFADKYWVGGTGNFSDPTDHWATSTGGSPGAGNTPLASDNCIFDANSGAGTATVDVATSCRSLLTSGSSLTTITHNSGINVALGDATAGTGNKALDLTGISTYNLGSVTTSTYSFVSTSATQQTINTNGLTMAAFTFNGTGSSYILAGALTMGTATANQLTFQTGTFNTGNYAVTAGGFYGTSSTNVSISLGSSVLHLGGGTPWEFIGMTGFSLNAGTSTINFDGASPPLHPGLGQTFYNVVITSEGANGGLNSIGSGSGLDSPNLGVGLTGPTTTFNNFTITGSAIKTAAFHFATPVVVNGTLTLNGNSTTNRLLMWAGGYANILGFPVAVTINGTISASNVDFQDWQVSPSQDLHAITGGAGDCGGNSGITFTSPLTLYWYHNTGNWSTAAQWSTNSSGGGGTNKVPLPQDSVNFNSSSFNTGSQTVTVDMPRLGASISAVGTSNAPTFSFSTTVTSYGSMTWNSNPTVTGGGTIWNFQGRGSYTFTRATRLLDFPFFIIMPGGTMTFQDAFVVNSNNTNTFTLTQGTLDTGSQAVTFRKFVLATPGTNVRTVNLNNSVVTLAATGLLWDATASGSTTLNAGTSVLTVTDTSAAGKSMTGGGLTYYGLSLAGGGTGAFKINDSNAWSTLPQITGGTETLTYTSGTTQTYKSSSDDSFSNGTNVVTINSTTAGTPAALVKNQGMVYGKYLSVQDSTAYGGWFDFPNGTNVSDNTGWLFTSPIAVIRNGNIKKGTL